MVLLLAGAIAAEAREQRLRKVIRSMEEPCPDCDGSGLLTTGEECDWCGGQGLVLKPATEVAEILRAALAADSEATP